MVRLFYLHRFYFKTIHPLKPFFQETVKNVNNANSDSKIMLAMIVVSVIKIWKTMPNKSREVVTVVIL